MEQKLGLGVLLKPNDAISILDASMRSRNSDTLPHPETRGRALRMAGYLDVYINSLVDTKIERSNGQRTKEEVFLEFEETRRFFLTNGEFETTPIERMAQIYETLTPPDDNTTAFEEAISFHSGQLIERAFDQHQENPERYVSHDFTHTLRVANYVRGFLDRDISTTLKAACYKYGLTEGDARFVFELIALFHDFGYPYLGIWTKPFHSFPAVEIISSPEMRAAHTQLIRSVMDRETLFTDINDAILRHAADKIEEEFPAVVDTKRQKSILGHGISIIQFQARQTEVDDGSDYAIRVVVRDQSMREQLLEDLRAKAKEFKDRTGKELIIPEIDVVEGPSFKGRRIRSNDPNEPGFGLEYSSVDINTLPFHAVVRLADNMDIAANRLSKVQRDAAFQEICRTFGDNGADSLELQRLEVRGDQEAGTVWKRQIIDTILAKSEHAERLKDSPDIIEKIRDIVLGQTSESFRHFGGCQVVKSVKVSGNLMEVVVDGSSFRQANTIRVKEKSFDENGKEIEISVGVGEYQLWRLQEAMNSITVGGRGILIMVRDDEGNMIDLRGAILI